jgi:hypothetical protein
VKAIPTRVLWSREPTQQSGAIALQTERGATVGGDGHGPSQVIDVEVVAVELVVAEFRVPSGRHWCDLLIVAGIAEFGAHRPGSVTPPRPKPPS